MTRQHVLEALLPRPLACIHRREVAERKRLRQLLRRRAS